jgi:NADPH:quinone reductase
VASPDDTSDASVVNSCWGVYGKSDLKQRIEKEKHMEKHKTMQAVTIDKYGGKEVLKLNNIPTPEAGPGEVLIRVQAAGVGVWDEKIREGRMKDMFPLKFPVVLGADGAGSIEAVGTGVRNFKVGDKVYGQGFMNPKGGFYAEFVALAEELVAPAPKSLLPVEAAALAVPGLTALHGVDGALHIKSGDSLLIFGVGSVGHAAIQLAKRLKARVIAVASSDDGVALAKAAGADVAVNSTIGGVAAAARKFAPEGLTAVLATVNGKGLDEAIAAIRQGGRVAYPTGVTPPPRGRPGVEAVAYNGEADRESFDRLNALIGAGPFKVQVDQVFPLSDVAAAHAAIQRHHLGRMALTIGSESIAGRY